MALEHAVKTRVSYADTDQMGYVHHAKYLEYFEMGRTEFMRAAGKSYAEVEKSGCLLVLTEAHVAYRRPAKYDMEITVRTRVRDVSHASVTFEYTIENGQEALCEGWTKLACTNRNGKLTRLPADISEALRRSRK